MPKTNSVFVRCEHFPEDHTGIGSLDYFFSLGGNKVLQLCPVCKAALAYEMVTMFYRECQPIQSPYFIVNPK